MAPDIVCRASWRGLKNGCAGPGWTRPVRATSFHSVETSAPFTVPAGQEELVSALRRGDERALASLVDEYGPAMLRVARMYVATRAVAEAVVQDAWLGVIVGVGRFEGRSSPKTWTFRILENTAKTRGERERRSVPFSAFGGVGDESAEPTEDLDEDIAGCLAPTASDAAA